MSPIAERIVTAKVEIIRRMIDTVATLPLESLESFTEDERMVAAGESMLRRALEALLDVGRHVAVKGFGRPVAEYKQIAEVLREVGVLSPERATILVTLAGYRNRMVHFYDEVTPAELHGVLSSNLTDVQVVLDEMLAWLGAHPEKVDASL
jgi:uncharacterized protein YutE (UPF0331/DUF86 family)